MAMLVGKELGTIPKGAGDRPGTGSALSIDTEAAEAGRRRAWASRYLTTVAVLDAAVFLGAAMAAACLRYASATPTLADYRIPFFLGALVATVIYAAALASAGCYDRRVIGSGTEEYRRVLNGGVRFVAAFALIEVGFRLQVSRSVVLATVPAAVVLSLGVHHRARRRLRCAQAKGQRREAMVVVGREREAEQFLRHLSVWGHSGIDVTAIYTGDGRKWASTQPGAPARIADREAFFALVRSGAVDSVAVVDQGALGEQGLRDLGWALEGLGVDIMVAPEATDVVGPRLAVRPVGGLPLLHVEEPRFTGPVRVVKDLVERVAAVFGLILTSPLLLVAAGAIKLNSPGPVLYRQTRVGRDGENFTMFKFRSMTTGAEAAMPDIIGMNDCDGLLFKMRSDPRITKVGRWMRRFSIDELPQLWNVMRGDMSVVGPRPPLPSEVERYPVHVCRRLLVKPGLTGLWQVNGRADLSWEDAVRLDLHYVDNWSPTGDLAILLRTLGAVVRGRGAY
ncbi:MAG: sugar transferase [Acidimicrobiales bacterium]